jgi:hypothetical protein
LIILDGGGVFVNTADADLYNADFYYQAQYQAARERVTLSYETLQQDAEGADVTSPSDHADVAALVRIQGPDDALTRLTTGPTWLVCNEEPTASDWYMPRFDDDEWAYAQPSSTLPPGEPWPAAPAMLLRRAFLVREIPKQARLYITALGAYEAHINGKRVGVSC